MMRRLGCLDDSPSSISNKEIISRSLKRSKLDSVFSTNQVDFNELFCIQYPRMKDGPAKLDATDSLTIHDDHTFCGSDSMFAQALAPKVDIADMTDMFQRIEAMYI